MANSISPESTSVRTAAGRFLRPSAVLEAELALGAQEVQENPDAAAWEHALIRSLKGKSAAEQQIIMDDLKRGFPSQG